MSGALLGDNLPSIKVIGDVAWMLLYHLSHKAQDEQCDALSPYRRVRDSKTLRLPAGCWLAAKFVRNAVGDNARIPVEIPLDLSQASLTLDAVPAPGEAVVPPFLLGIGAANLSITFEVSKVQIHGEVIDGNTLPVIEATVVSDVDPSVLLSLQNAVGAGVQFETHPNASAISQFVAVSIDVKTGATLPPTLKRTVVVLSSQRKDAPCSALLDLNATSDVAALLEPRQRHASGKRRDPLIKLPTTGRVIFPGLCHLGFGEYVPGQSSDDPRLKYATSWEKGGICRLKLPDGTQADVQFTSFQAASLTRICIYLQRPLADVVLPVVATSCQKRMIDLWKEKLERNIKPLALIQTYSHASVSKANKIWWEVKVSDDTTSARLGRVLSYDDTRKVEESYRHGKLRSDFVPDDLVARQLRHLVLFDLNFGFRKGPERPDWADDLVSWANCPDGRGVIVANLARSLPFAVSRKGQVKKTWDSDDLWQALRNGAAETDDGDVKFNDRVIVVVSAQLLRANGARISVDLSWEHAAKDCIKAIKEHKGLRPLSEFRHVVIRLKNVGALYIHGDQHYLIYDVLSPTGSTREADQGRVLGNNSVLTASILRAILLLEKEHGGAMLNDDLISRAVRDGIRNAVPCMDRLQEMAYEPFTAIPATDFLNYTSPERIFCPLDGISATDISKEGDDGHRVISEVIVGKDDDWSLVSGFSEDEIRASALEYVRTRGHAGRAIKQDASIIRLTDNMCVPVGRFGSFVAVARQEIEAYHSIQAILKRYIESDTDKPISFAVFGPPGSGKSFGIRAVAESVGVKKHQRHEFNMAQFSSANDLVIPLLKARDVEGGVPMIFFDEFDSQLGGTALGWLRYFLQPMQDGTFKHGEEVRKVGKAIFVFAGGTSESFSHFARNGATPKQVDEFKEAKGPDFVSRLSGYIDTLGINQTASGKSDPGHILRRAVLLRALLEQRRLIGETKRALIDDTFIAALLKVKSYTHGARSMETILKMCVGDNGEIRLPTWEQLRMHVGDDDAMKTLWQNSI